MILLSAVDIAVISQCATLFSSKLLSKPTLLQSLTESADKSRGTMRLTSFRHHVIFFLLLFQQIHVEFKYLSEARTQNYRLVQDLKTSHLLIFFHFIWLTCIILLFLQCLPAC